MTAPDDARRRRAPRPWAAALLIAASCGSSAPLPAAKGPRLVLLYATCSLSKEHLQPYRPSVRYTPNLAAFARESLVFERHETEAGQSGIAFASLFSGTQAPRHGVYLHPTRLSEDLLLVSEAFAAGGWEPWFWSVHPMASARLGYGQGVPPENVFLLPDGADDDDGEGDGSGGSRRTRHQAKRHLLGVGDELFAGLLDRLVADPAARAFVQVDFTVTHDPYHRQITRRDLTRFCERFPDVAQGVTPELIDRYLPLYFEHRLELQWDFPGAVERLGLAPEDVADLARVLEVVYSAAVHGLDRMFGETLDLLRARGLLDDSLVVFTADHGEVLYRENALYKWTHGLQLAPEVLSVPLMMRAPRFGVRPGRYAAVTRSIDVYPTIAGLCGLPLPKDGGPEGVDLSAAVRGEQPPPRLLAFSHTTTIGKGIEDFSSWGVSGRFWDRTGPEPIWVRIRDGDMVYKLRDLGQRRWGVQVFDLARDPQETRDLFEPGNPEHEAFAERLRAYKQELVEGFERSEGQLGDARSVDDLRKLGYIR